MSLKMLVFVVFSVLLFPAWATGAAAPVPTRVELPLSKDDRPVLVVESSAGARSFSLAQLEALGLYRVSTSTFWPGDEGVFEGPLLADVLKAAGLADVAEIRVSALDGFTQIVPHEDWARWPVMLATRKQGQPMTTRNKGPIRIVYPRDMDPQLADARYRLRWVWLLKRIEGVSR